MAKNRPILVYDGNCKLCRNTVRLLKNGGDSDRMEYIASSDPLCEQLLESYHLPEEVTKRSVILLESDKAFLKSTAIIRTLNYRGGIWHAINILRIIPAFIRNLVYDLIANLRK